MSDNFAPTWAVKSFVKMILKLQKLDISIRIMQNGFHTAYNSIKIVKLIKKVKPDEKIDFNMYSDLSEKANAEIQAGFPFIYSNATILIWSYLESAIRQFIFNLLQNDSKFMNIDEIKKIKISIVDYNNLNDEERIDYLIEQYEKNIANGINYGSSRFESLLKPFGFSGKVPSKLSKNIFELAQIRNLLLHKGGVYDLFIKNKCPWLNYKIGEEIVVDINKYKIYYTSVNDYMALIIHRIGTYWGADMGDINTYIENA